MATTKKLTGIIYCAYNKVTEKSYVGKTVRELSIRRNQHIKNAKRQYNYKFVNALRSYPESVWEWSVLIEVEINELDKYEQFFIQDLDTLKNGYNSVLNNYRPGEKCNYCYDASKVYELYHHVHGQISGTRDELRQVDSNLVDMLGRLISGKRMKSYKGWILLENKGSYKPLQVIDVLTLTHPEFGTHTLTRKEFKEQFKFPTYALSRLALKTRKSWCKWRLVEDK